MTDIKTNKIYKKIKNGVNMFLFGLYRFFKYIDISPKIVRTRQFAPTDKKSQ